MDRQVGQPVAGGPSGGREADPRDMPGHELLDIAADFVEHHDTPGAVGPRSVRSRCRTA